MPPQDIFGVIQTPAFWIEIESKAGGYEKAVTALDAAVVRT